MNISSIVSVLKTAAAILALSIVNVGCYLLQSASGQLQVMIKREPIAHVIADPHTKPAVRAQLQAVSAIRDFASRQLLLPDNGSYRLYADVKRPYVVWNVFAAPEFGLEPKQWCYPIAGCVDYRGYFREKRALAFAAKLHAQGYDVATGGVSAYSTLGHFNDPILSSMLGWSDVQLAATVFHELTHQLLYVPNDSAFNEALATTVEEEGLRRWMLAQGRAAELARYDAQEDRYQQVIALLIHARDTLAKVYRSGSTAPVMREQKRLELAALREDFNRLKIQWGGHAPFEAWFTHDLNNAYLVSVATYHRCVPGFKRELAAVDGDLSRFYARARELAAMKRPDRQRLLCAG